MREDYLFNFYPYQKNHEERMKNKDVNLEQHNPTTINFPAQRVKGKFFLTCIEGIG